LIDAKHPLKTAHITQVWPCLKFLSCCFGKPKRSFKLALKRSLREKLGITMPKSDLRIEQDPFLRTGFGINAYFDIILQLTYMMLFISIVTLPCMMIFARYDTLAGKGMGLQVYTTGNLGGASFQCGTSPLASSGISLPMSCPTGAFSMSMKT